MRVSVYIFYPITSLYKFILLYIYYIFSVNDTHFELIKRKSLFSSNFILIKMDTLFVKNIKKYQSAYYLCLQNQFDQEIFISTATVKLVSSSLKRLLFVVKKSQCEELYEKVNQLEISVIDILKHKLTDTHLSSLPSHLRSKLATLQEDSILRPNYSVSSLFDENEPKVYLKGNRETISMFTWDGQKIDDAILLGNGYYQFIIRASLVYLGQHGSKPCVANLQLRVVKLRYKPFENNELMVCPYEWNFDSDQQADDFIDSIVKEITCTDTNTHSFSVPTPKKTRRPRSLSRTITYDNKELNAPKCN